MKPDLTQSFPPSWAGVPAGMPAQDYTIWLRYRPLFASQFTRVYFNVRVGEPAPKIAGLSPEIEKVAEDISRRRIDVVGEKENEWWLLELKALAGTDALGQMVMYKSLWESDPPDGRKVIPCIVTDRADINLTMSARSQGIVVIVV